jgi:MFS family permease
MKFTPHSIEFSRDVNITYLLLICSLAASAQFVSGFNLIGFNFGFYQPSKFLFTLYVMCLAVGQFIGTFSVKFLSRRSGRRPMLVMSFCVLLIGLGLVRSTQEMTGNLVVAFIGKFVTSFACGVGSTVAPIYSEHYSVKEVAPSELSGKLGGLNQVFYTIGLCSAAYFQLISLEDFGGLQGWRLGGIVFSVIVLIDIALFMMVLPDTPHWYFEQGNQDAAKRLIRKIFINPYIVVEQHIQIKEEVRVNPDSNKGILTAMRKHYSVIALSVAISSFNFHFNFSSDLLYLSTTVVLNIVVLLLSDRDL